MHGKKMPKKMSSHKPSAPTSTEEAREKAGMGAASAKKRRRFPPPPPAVQAGGTGPGFTMPGGGY